MNTKQTAELRRRLRDERERILSEWRSHGGNAGPTDDDWDLNDPEEQAVLLTSETVTRHLANDELNLLRKIDFALQRLEQGTYFHCANCGQPIPLDRLLAKPSVSLCLACQRAKDERPASGPT